MTFTQSTLHHVLYIESDAVQLAKYGFSKNQPRSIWVQIQNEAERNQLDSEMDGLHRSGRIKFYAVSACLHGDDSSLEMMFEELDDLRQTLTVR